MIELREHLRLTAKARDALGIVATSTGAEGREDFVGAETDARREGHGTARLYAFDLLLVDVQPADGIRPGAKLLDHILAGDEPGNRVMPLSRGR